MVIKKKVSLLYLITLLFVFILGVETVSATEYVNYHGIEMSEEEYSNLVGLGFTEDEIYYMSEEVFSANKDVDSTLVAQNINYYKTIYNYLDGNSYSVEVTESEYENQGNISPLTVSETTYKRMVSTISRNSDNTFRFKVNLSWKIMPSTRSYDIIGIGFSNSRIYISSFVYVYQDYCYTNGNCTTTGAFYDMKELSTGGAAVIKLPTGSLSSLSSTLYYDVDKNTTETITQLLMYGDYAHATQNVNRAIYTNYTVNNSGIQLFENINYYDEIPYADQGWVGTW